MHRVVQTRARVVALAIATLVATCGTGGLVENAAPVDRLTPGITTVVDATALLAPHTSEKGYLNGQLLLQWSSGATSSTRAATRRIAILFGEDGRMLGVIHAAAEQDIR